MFRVILLRAAARRNDLSADQRKALRQVVFFPRRRVDGEVVRLDDQVEEQVISMAMVEQPALFAGALMVAADPAVTGPEGLVGKIDWAKLFDWIVTNLPKIIEIIMSLIALF